MAPNVEIVADIVPEYRIPIETTVVEINRYGQPILFDAINEDDVNYSWVLEQAIEDVPLYTYIGCGNCGMPVCEYADIIDIIPAVRFGNVPVGYVLPVIPNSWLTDNTNLMNWSTIIWETRIKCANCGILLTVPALTTINQNIGSFSSDVVCVILDASAVCFYRREIF